MAVSKLIYRQIDDYVEKHKAEMISDILTLCRIDSEKMPYQMGSPFGVGITQALSSALNIAEGYGFTINNYDNYVGTADLAPDKEKRLDIPRGRDGPSQSHFPLLRRTGGSTAGEPPTTRGLPWRRCSRCAA